MSRSGCRFRVTKPDTASINNEFVKIDREIRGKPYTVAALPRDGSLLHAVVSDEAGGPTLAFWDGSDWLRAHDLASVT
jgi:hypothetical protein